MVPPTTDPFRSLCLPMVRMEAAKKLWPTVWSEVQLMPLPLTVSCFSKIQIGFTFLVPADLGSPGQRAVKRVSVRCSSSSSGAARILYQWGSEVCVGGLEYEVPQKLTHLLQCIGNL